MLKITRNTGKCIGVLRVAKSAQRHYVADLLPDIKSTTLLIWGREDQITPVHDVAEFQAGIPDATAVVIEACGHAPMMENHLNSFKGFRKNIPRYQRKNGNYLISLQWCGIFKRVMIF
ncbi:MAG: alpha/beta fold hydrolase [Flavitalea sp.]